MKSWCVYFPQGYLCSIECKTMRELELCSPISLLSADNRYVNRACAFEMRWPLYNFGLDMCVGALLNRKFQFSKFRDKLKSCCQRALEPFFRGWNPNQLLVLLQVIIPPYSPKKCIPGNFLYFSGQYNQKVFEGMRARVFHKRKV